MKTQKTYALRAVSIKINNEFRATPLLNGTCIHKINFFYIFLFFFIFSNLDKANGNQSLV